MRVQRKRNEIGVDMRKEEECSMFVHPLVDAQRG